MIESDILQHAKELADDILRLTNALVITGEKEQELAEIEDYITLMDEREPLIEQLTELQPSIEAAMAKSPLFEAIKQTIAEIAKLDKVHLQLMEQKHSEIKVSYKEIKQGQRIHAGYSPLPGTEGYSKFDVTQ